ncbi:MAG: hypothetical protein LDL53_08980 [Candidatus Hydrogenedens sp.]|nr:hypothetical protein [Candidatus Hydrogenedens sp.]
MSEHFNSDEEHIRDGSGDFPEHSIPPTTEIKAEPINIEENRISSDVPPTPFPNGNVRLKGENLFRWLLLGILLLFLIGHWEDKQLRKKPWSRGAILWEEDIINEVSDKIADNKDVEQVIVIPNVCNAEDRGEDTIVQMLKKIELGDEKNIPSIPYPAFIWLKPANTFLPMLASGRLPEPGKREALAGDLAPTEPFNVGEETYTVVGVLSKDCAPFVGAYVIPIENILKIPTTISIGFFFPDNETLISILHSLDAEKVKKIDIRQGISGLQIRTSALFAIATALSLLIICWSFREILALFYIRLANPPTLLLGPLFHEIKEHRRFFRFVNTFFYAVFFINLFTALYEPETHRLIIYYINQVFSEGNLQYIGEAYERGDILQAAINTFHNNFWVQTFLLTILISIPPFLLGVLKNLVSFAFAGYAMAPIWAGTAVRLTFHSITIVLELEAYILAVFAVLLWTYYVWNVLFTRKNCLMKFTKGFRILISATLASACLLAIAALYEATTIILLSNFIS